ncbi:MAG: ATP-binding cassette domain-containing protein [Brevinematales bacterium]|jgi:ABC-2 type transport system ATP-binding protein
MSKNIIEVSHYTQKYGSFKAVDDISFTVAEGSIFAFLGPNGAGKSTTINTLCTIQGRTEGVLKINGHDVAIEKDKVRSDIGIVFQESTLDNNLTVSENLRLHCDFYNVPVNEVAGRVDFVLELVDMQSWKKSRVKALSGGMKRRVEIARGLIHFPKILFLDEPTAGLDAQTRASIWDYIRKLQKQKNITIFLTTHYMEEAEICDYVAIIDHGRIAAYDTLYNLKEKLTSSTVRILIKESSDLESYLKDNSIPYREEENLFTFQTNETEKVLDIASRFKSVITGFEVHKGTLNEVFLAITGKGVRI